MLKNKFFAGILMVNDENSKTRIQDPDPNPDPLVRGMDSRIRIRIHPKMSWIRNTGSDEGWGSGQAASPAGTGPHGLILSSG